MQVVVDRLESTSDLHAHLSPSTMSRLQIDEDDVIKIASPARKFIIIAVSSKGFHGADNSICIGRNFRQLLECYLGETVTIEPFKFCQAATKVVLAPIFDTMNGITGNFLNVIKNSNYDFNNIPVWEDMVIPIYAMQHVFEFRVIECKPIFAVIITDPDVIQCQNESVERVKSPVFDKICYDDIGGIDPQLFLTRIWLLEFFMSYFLAVIHRHYNYTLNVIYIRCSFVFYELLEVYSYCGYAKLI